MQLAHPEQPDRKTNSRVWWILGFLFAAAITFLTWFYTLYDLPSPAPSHYEPPAWPLPELSKDHQLELDQAWAEVLAAWHSRKPRPKLYITNKAPTRLEIDKANQTADQQFLKINLALMAKFWAFAELATKHQALPSRAEDLNHSSPVFSEFWYFVELDIQQQPTAQSAASFLDKGLRLMDLSQLIARLGPDFFESALLLEKWGMHSLPYSLAQVRTNPDHLRKLLVIALQTSTAEKLLPWKAETLLVEALITCRDAEPAELRSHTLGPSPLLPPMGDSNWKDNAEDSLFKRNMTLMELIEARKPLSQAFSQNAQTGRRFLEALINKHKSTSRHENELSQLLPNRLGKTIVMSKLRDINWKIDPLLESISTRRCLSLILALRIHELEHSSLPMTLDDLSPHYLTTLPVDPITGQSMKWHRDDGKIYSVGENGWDDGGIFEKGKKSYTPPDWGVVYPWQTSGQ